MTFAVLFTTSPVFRPGLSPGYGVLGAAVDSHKNRDTDLGVVGRHPEKVADHMSEARALPVAETHAGNEGQVRAT